MVVIFSLLFTLFYVYIFILRMIPNWMSGFKAYVFVAIVYCCFLYNIFFEFLDFDIRDQNAMFILLFFVATISYIFKNEIKNLIKTEYLNSIIEIVSAVSIHLCLYDKNMSETCVFLYSFSFTFITFKVFHRYLSTNF